MVQTIVAGVVIGGLVAILRRRRDARAKERQARSRERLAAILLYEEIEAAIDAIDMALQNHNSKWLASMSQSATLVEVWREHAPALQELGPERWYVISDAVNAMAPTDGLTLDRAGTEDRRCALNERRELLAQSADVLLNVRDLPTRGSSPERRGTRSLLRLIN